MSSTPQEIGTLTMVAASFLTLLMRSSLTMVCLLVDSSNDSEEIEERWMLTMLPVYYYGDKVRLVGRSSFQYE
jgi:hypothetical protein